MASVSVVATNGKPAAAVPKVSMKSKAIAKKRPAADALVSTKDRNKNYQFYSNFYKDLPDHIRKMHDEAKCQGKTKIINALLSKDESTGNWLQNYEQPIFQDTTWHCIEHTPCVV